MPELEHVKCSTPDFAEENARKLLELFPDCAGEAGEVDIDKLRQVLSSTVVEGNVERYQFTWPGKRAAMAAASAATTKTLRPCREESAGRDGTPGGFDSENLYIEGDNLEVLKLLQTSYAGKVKMIYIDPPYNTGHDFVYRDRFSLTQKELESEAGAFDEDGNRFEVNDSAEARYHSNWCSMMYPRLKLARNLLRDDGVIFISIDDNEVTNLRKLCDEVLGEANFVAQFVWKSKLGKVGTTTTVASTHEYIVCFARNIENTTFKMIETPNDGRKENLRQWGQADRREDRPSMYYPININGVTVFPVKEDGSDGRWRVGQEMAETLLKDGQLELVSRNGKNDIYRIFPAGVSVTPYETLLLDEIGTTAKGSLALKALEMNKWFDYSKPVELVAYFARLLPDPSALILDFFSGSATTAHAVMQLNAEDGGNRKFIMVQLPEPCAEDSEAAKAGYANICEIGKERIRRAGKKIAEELAAKNAEIAKKNEQGELGLENLDNPVNLVEKEIPDIGFRVLKLDSSSLRDVSATVGETTQEFADFERVKSDRSSEDLLFQMLLETRIPLSEPISTATIRANQIFVVGVANKGTDKLTTNHSPLTTTPPLVACLDGGAKMDSQFFIEIAKLKPGIAFFRDDAFEDDSARVNLSQIFAQFSPTTSVKVI